MIFCSLINTIGKENKIEKVIKWKWKENEIRLDVVNLFFM